MERSNDSYRAQVQVNKRIYHWGYTKFLVAYLKQPAAGRIRDKRAAEIEDDVRQAVRDAMISDPYGAGIIIRKILGSLSREEAADARAWFIEQGWNG